MKKVILIFILSIVISTNLMSATIEDKIAGLYVAFFNRAADKIGLEYWKTQAYTLGEDVAITRLAAGFATHPKFTALYEHLNNKGYVEAIYINSLGQAGDSDGINYWKSLLDNGMIRSDMVATFVYLSLDFNKNDPQYKTLSQDDLDKADQRRDLIANKVEASLYFVEMLGDNTNLNLSTNAMNPDALDSDETYRASVNILSNIDHNINTREIAKNLITQLITSSSKSMRAINRMKEYNGQITDDNSIVTIALKDANVGTSDNSIWMKHFFNQDEKDFLYEQLSTNYLWSEHVENKTYSQYIDPNEMIDGFKYDTLDKWSYAETFGEYYKESAQEESGFGCYFMGTPTIHFIEIGSPCEEAGLKRGDRLLGINHIPVTNENYVTAKNDLGITVTFNIQRNSASLDIVITPKYYIYKVSKKNIFTTQEGKKVGYFIFNGFSARSTEEIDESFAYFKENNIEELIIDIRYNGGGRISVAQYLLDMIAGLNYEGELQFRIDSNDPKEIEESYFMKHENSLDLSRVFFLTSEYTASASELVINSLKPYLDVIVIGDTTRGKPVGMSARYTSNNNILYWLIDLSIYNADGVGEYFQGINPNCSGYDVYFMTQRGNSNEVLLREAMTYIDTNACSIGASDLDTDGILDYHDNDSDNDGVIDSEDSHPYNNQCSKGDNEENLDCFKDKLDDAKFIIPMNNSNNLHIVIHSDLNKALIYNIENDEFESFIPIQNKKPLDNYSSINIKTYVYNENQNILYLGYDNGDVTKINFNNSEIKEENLLNLGIYDPLLILPGNSTLVLYASFYYNYNKRYIYDLEGNLLKEERISSIEDAKFDESNNKLYFNKSSILSYEIIDENDGSIIESKSISVPNDGSIVFSNDKTKLLLNNKDIYDSETLNYEGSLESRGYMVHWDENNNLLSVKYDYETKETIIEIVNKKLELISRKVFTDKEKGSERFLSITKENDEYIFLIRKDSRIDTLRWQPEEYNNEEYSLIETFQKHTYNINSTDIKILKGDKFLLFFVAEDYKEKIVRYDLDNKEFVDKIIIRDTYSGVEDVEFDKLHNTLYLLYDDGYLSKIDFSKERLKEEKIVSVPNEIESMILYNNLIVLQNHHGDDRLVYDLEGNQKFANFNYNINEKYNINNLIRDENRDKLYYLTYDKLFEINIDSINAELIEKIELLDISRFHGTDFKISDDYDRILIANSFESHIYDVNTLFKIKTFDDDDLRKFYYMDNEYFIYSSSFSHKDLIILDSNFEEIETKVFNQKIMKVLKLENKFILIKYDEENKEISIDEFVPNYDLDEDGIKNIEDAFPSDSSASIDLDKDGFPDKWNDGYSEEDSITGLSLDYYPNDQDCNLLDHGDGTTCDMNKVMPIFTPDNIVQDKEGTIYLLSNENNRIYRWDSINKYKKPIVLDEQYSNKITYSKNHNRLYISYSSKYQSSGDADKVTYINFDNDSLEEKIFIPSFPSLPYGIGYIEEVGNYILIEEVNLSWVDKFVYNKDGILESKVETTHKIDVSFWDSIKNRYYYTPYGSYPSDLYYHEINQETGEILDDIETPYHGDYEIKGPIIVSKDGENILLGTGDIYNSDDLTWKDSINDSFTSGAGIDNNEIIYGYIDGENTIIKRQNSSFELIESKSYEGQFLKILEISSNKFLIITKKDKLLFNEYIF